MSRNGTPSSPTPCSREPAGAFDREPVEARGVEAVDGGPAVGAVADVRRDALLAGDRDQARDEAVVALAVHGRREPDDRGPDAALGKGERRVLRGDSGPRGVEHVRFGPEAVRLERRASQREPSVPEVITNGLSEPSERLADRLDGAQVGSRAASRHVGEVVVEGEVDDAVGGGRALRAGCRGRRESPRCTSAPAAARAAAEASERARPTT